ncbi:WG repeat-containing protein, partial [Campylobacter coli]|nr:WG repeat-containing protein [Campylobacter coli]
VGLNGKWGFIDKSGKIVIEPKFDSIWSFREGLVKVGLNGKYGLIDKSGKIVIEPKFDDIGY